MHIRLIALALFSLLSISLFAQGPRWVMLSDSDIERIDLKDQIFTPSKFKAFHIDFEELNSYLSSNLGSSFIIDIPFPDGTTQEFKCENAALISDGLQIKYPTIMSFNGRGLSNRSSVIKFGISPKGFHGMILTPGSSPIFIDVLTSGKTSYYMSYFKSDYQPAQSFDCHFENEDLSSETISQEAMSFAGDCQLRSYRLALACTGEYATFHGGTKESTLAEFAVAMARVNGIYEKDLGITMILIDNTDEVIFLNASTDPYTNNEGGTMLGENQATLDDIIGTDNYDIGHVFSTGGGGIASLQSPCNSNRKARGVTGLGSPVNDPFYVDYVSHEMGHQFGGNHTQNNDCNRAAAAAMEVGSGNTIMGYAGICSPNSKNNSDDHFHAINIQEIAEFIVNGNGSTCAMLIETDNNAPIVSVTQSTYAIPANTPFMLSAIATDSDGDVLTYCWEQMDNEVADMPPALTNTGGPAFISNSPLLSETRYFPNLDALVNNQTPEWEVLPGVSRQMNFRVTVRDNHNLSGCTDETDVELNVDDNAGPFLVEYPNTFVTWQAATEETVEWDVANTDGGSINCLFVDILLSIDGGFTYPITLAEQVPNVGSHTIVVPAEFTSTARVMVVCSDNVFFDISNNNFTIETPFLFVVDQEMIVACQGDQDSIVINTQGFNGFAETIDFEIENMPIGVDYSFSTNPVSSPNSTTLELTAINAVPGEYNFNILASAAGITVAKTIRLFVEPNTIDFLTPLSPENGAIEVGLTTMLSWVEEPGISTYQVVVSQSPTFTDPIVINAQEVASVTLTELEPNTVYYWKVIAITSCATDVESDLFAFQTPRDGICNQRVSDNIPLDISATQIADYSSNLIVEDIGSFDYITCFIDLEHTYLGDIVFSLISPQGTEILLMDQIGVPASNFGCDSDDIIVTFSDLSSNSAEDLEGTCGSFESLYQPITPFTNLTGENVNGEWTLVVSDLFAQDGGEVVAWNLEFCEEASLEGPVLVNDFLIVPFDSEQIVTKEELEVDVVDVSDSYFTLLSTPEHGDLMQYSEITAEFEILVVGSVFDQKSINDGNILYRHNGDDATTDAFRFDAIDGLSRWVHDQTFNIIIATTGNPVIIPSIETPILCTGDKSASIEVRVIGGNGPFEYSFDGGMLYQMDSVAVDLAAGTYNVVVIDVNGLEIYNDFVTIDNVDPLMSAASSSFYDIVASAAGGTPLYTYSLNGIDFVTDPVFEGVDPGLYTITIRDANGCETTVQLDHQYEELELVVNTLDILCFGESQGEINLSAIGGFEPYSYSLDGLSFDESGFFGNLSAGTYTVFVEDGGGRVVTQEVVITQGQQIEFVLEATTTGFTVQNVFGGSAPYEYSLNDVDYVSTPLFEPLPDGDFTIYVRDQDGCTQSLSYSQVGAQIDVTDPACVGDENGMITAAGFGGFPPLSYSLDGGDFQDSGVFDNLGSGDYSVIVRDAFGFTSELAVTVTDPTPITVSTEYVGGELIITAVGGTGVYEYSIDGGLTFQSSNVFPIDMDDDYPIVVRDSQECLDESMIVLTLVDNREVELDALIHIYPVPVRDLLFVSLDPSIIQQPHFKVFNAVGQQLPCNPILDSNRLTIDFSRWPAGQYVLVIQSDEKLVTRKVIKF